MKREIWSRDEDHVKNEAGIRMMHLQAEGHQSSLAATRSWNGSEGSFPGSFRGAAALPAP